MINRRKLIVMLGTGALTATFGSFAQLQGKVWRVGFLAARSRPASFDTDVFSALPSGLRELGYAEGRNLIIEWRYADGVPERLPELAAELVQLKSDILVTAGTLATLAAQKATSTIPIVMVGVGDPVADGLVKSLARPGGSTTGVSNMTSDLGPKLLEMVLAMAPKVSRVAILINPTNSAHAAVLKNVQATAQRINVTIVSLETRSPQEIDNAFSRLTRQNAKAIIVPLEALFQQQKDQIVKLAAKQHLPSISGRGEFAEAGGLMSYSVAPADGYRRAATYVDKILKGGKPADLPVEQPTRFELVINMKVAKALGLKVPSSILVQATKVID